MKKVVRGAIFANPADGKDRAGTGTDVVCSGDGICLIVRCDPVRGVHSEETIGHTVLQHNVVTEFN